MTADLVGRKRGENAPSGALVQMRDIVKTFKTPAGDFAALKGIYADFEAGEFISVVGKSGSGKSTLVNMITGIDRPTSGTVKIADTYVHGMSESEMARWRGRNLGIVFQFYQLLPMLSLLENVVLPMDFGEMYPPSKREARALELLDMVGLANVAHEMPASVSGGQQQSAAIARALANDPPLIVADEPTGNLDSVAAARVVTVFEELARQGKTIVMVTHDKNLAQRAGRTMLLVDGEVVNETVVATLPLLSHPQLLKATKSLRARQYAPGETIIRQGEPNDSFYMIAKGYADVLLEEARRAPFRIASLGPGQHFGEIELLRSSARAVASIRAALHMPVEVLALSREVFGELMGEAGAMRERLMGVVQERLSQNARLSRGGDRARYAQTALA